MIVVVTLAITHFLKNNMKLGQELIDLANKTSVEDILSRLNMPMTLQASSSIPSFSSSLTTITLKLYTIDSLPPDLFEWAFQLVKSNLYDM